MIASFDGIFFRGFVILVFLFCFTVYEGRYGLIDGGSESLVSLFWLYGW